MRLVLGLVSALLLNVPANADDWTGKTVRVKQDGLKFGRKLGRVVWCATGPPRPGQDVLGEVGRRHTAGTRSNGFVFKSGCGSGRRRRKVPEAAQGRRNDEDRGRSEQVVA